MGLFKKEACCICGKEVGALSRIRLKSGECLCDDCAKQGHPFIPMVRLTKDEAEALIAEMQENEARFQETSASFRKTSRMIIGKSWTYYDNMQTGEFVLETPETQRYPNRFIYKMSEVAPNKDDKLFSARLGSFPTVKDKLHWYFNIITVEQKKDQDGKTDSWKLHLPYDRDHMRIDVKFPGSMSEQDVRLLQSTMQATIGTYNAGVRLTPTQLDEIQKAGCSLGKDNTASAAEKLGQLFTAIGGMK